MLILSQNKEYFKYCSLSCSFSFYNIYGVHSILFLWLDSIQLCVCTRVYSTGLWLMDNGWFTIFHTAIMTNPIPMSFHTSSDISLGQFPDIQMYIFFGGGEQRTSLIQEDSARHALYGLYHFALLPLIHVNGSFFFFCFSSVYYVVLFYF